MCTAERENEESEVNIKTRETKAAVGLYSARKVSKANERLEAVQGVRAEVKRAKAVRVLETGRRETERLAV